LSILIIIIYSKLRNQYFKPLKNSEKRFRTIVENIHSVSYRCLCDEHWTELFISDEIEALSGYPATDFLQNKVRSYRSIIHPEDQQMDRDITLKALDSKETYTLEYRIIASDGTIRWVYERGQGIFDEQDKIHYLDGVILNITDRKLAEDALQRREKQLRAIINIVPAMIFE